MLKKIDRLCGLVVRVPAYRTRGLASISGATNFFWEVVCLERGPLSLLIKTEELLGRISRGSGLESREYGGRDPSRWQRGTLYPQKFPLTSPTTFSRSVDMVWSRSQATKFSQSLCCGGTSLESCTWHRMLWLFSSLFLLPLPLLMVPQIKLPLLHPTNNSQIH
jgi:hypothetical protein